MLYQCCTSGSDDILSAAALVTCFGGTGVFVQGISASWTRLVSFRTAEVPLKYALRRMMQIPSSTLGCKDRQSLQADIAHETSRTALRICASTVPAGLTFLGWAIWIAAQALEKPVHQHSQLVRFFGLVKLTLYTTPRNSKSIGSEFCLASLCPGTCCSGAEAAVPVLSPPVDVVHRHSKAPM